MKKYSAVQQQIIKNVQKLNHLDRRNWQVDSPYYESVQKSIYGCLHFISDEFGSAFCYDGKKGYIMTCAHCVIENEDEDKDDSINVASVDQSIQISEPPQKKRGRPKKIQEPQQHAKPKQTFHLIFANGEDVECKVVKYNKKLDIAVLQIIQRGTDISQKIYPQIEIFQEGQLKKFEELICIGQPAYHDMESTKSQKTNYPPFYISKGYFEGYTLDPIYGVQEKELGPLKHSCWTYWGHSGSPIINLQGKVIGIHNSWNENNGMRHGVSIHAIREFQKLYPHLFSSQNENKQDQQM
ncbi:hypothetical protein ABPG74_001152 [Tetrahymena malaccensis]